MKRYKYHFFYIMNVIIGFLVYLVPLTVEYLYRISVLELDSRFSFLLYYMKRFIAYSLIVDEKYPGVIELSLFICYNLLFLFLFFIPFVWIVFKTFFNNKKEKKNDAIFLVNLSFILNFNLILIIYFCYGNIALSMFSLNDYALDFLFITLTNIVLCVLILSSNINRLILNNFGLYIVFYIVFLSYPFYLMYISNNSFEDLQFFFYFSFNKEININLSKTLSLVSYLSPYNPINLSMFFSVNHFLFSKKIFYEISTNTEENTNFKLYKITKYFIIFGIIIFIILSSLFF